MSPSQARPARGCDAAVLAQQQVRMIHDLASHLETTAPRHLSASRGELAAAVGRLEGLLAVLPGSADDLAPAGEPCLRPMRI